MIMAGQSLSGATVTSQIQVVLNWTEELQRRTTSVVSGVANQPHHRIG